MIYNGPEGEGGVGLLRERLTINDYGCQTDIHRSQGRRVADLPGVQERVEGTQIQAAWLAVEYNRVLVSTLPHAVEHIHHVQRVNQG